MEARRWQQTQGAGVQGSRELEPEPGSSVRAASAQPFLHRKPYIFYKVTVMSQTTSIGGNKSTKITKDFDFHHPCVSARTNTCASIPNVRCSPSWVETVSEGKERLTGQTLISRENVENDSRRGLAFVSQSEIMELQF